MAAITPKNLNSYPWQEVLKAEIIGPVIDSSAFLSLKKADEESLKEVVVWCACVLDKTPEDFVSMAPLDGQKIGALVVQAFHCTIQKTAKAMLERLNMMHKIDESLDMLNNLCIEISGQPADFKKELEGSVSAEESPEDDFQIISIKPSLTEKMDSKPLLSSFIRTTSKRRSYLI